MLQATDDRVSIYQPEQKGLIFPEMPRFASPAEERQYRKEHLVAAVRAFALQGFDYGFAGHLTVRDPEHPQYYWTNPMCVHFSQAKLSNLVLADHAGNVVEGNPEKVVDIIDIWTFARDVDSRNPNWKLIATQTGH